MKSDLIHNPLRKVLKPDRAFLLEKEVGETPLECLERFRTIHPEYKDEPMTYAGRLDPLASGALIILVGEECKQKDIYLSLKKEYEVKIVFGISTDTHDALGLPIVKLLKNQKPEAREADTINFSSYMGRFTQKYPAYSSKTVDGVALHTHSRHNTLPEEMPTKEVEIYSISQSGAAGSLTSEKLISIIETNIKKVRGDFRQNAILLEWHRLLGTGGAGNVAHFKYIKIKVTCSSGTYMRSLANRIGNDLGMGGFAFSIHRSQIFY